MTLVGSSIWVAHAGASISSVATDRTGDNERIVGSVLLSVALGAIRLGDALWSWRSTDRWPSGHAY